MPKIKIIKYIPLVLFFASLFISPVKAQGEFSTSYVVTYDILKNGDTKVTQEVTLENLTRDYYASEYTLSVSTSKIEEISASDANGPITPIIQKGKDNTNINLIFNNQVVGKGKKLNFSTSYLSNETVNKQGRIWEVNIPKLSDSSDITSYDVKVIVPKIFGSEMFVYPEPLKRDQSGDIRIYYFDKTDVELGGVSASFGDFQLYSFNLTYHLKNPVSSPIITEIALPPDMSNAQQIYYSDLSPKPRNIRIDDDGNYLAEYLLKSKEELDINLSGLAKVVFILKDLKNSGRITDIPENIATIYTKPQKFWETYDFRIIEKAEELTDQENLVSENAKSIYDFVTSNYTYSNERINDELTRYGASYALDKKDEAVCMEFADLFITLSRAVGIPAREIDGYAYTPDTEKRPTIGDVLHSWVQVYIPNIGWIQIDPTWGSTTKGLDYFNKLDTNHFAFVIKGLDSEWPYPAGAYKLSPDQVGDIEVDFATDAQAADFKNIKNPNFTVDVKLPNINAAPLPLKGKLIVENTSPVSLFSGQINVSAQNLNFGDYSQLNIGTLPPKTKKEIQFISKKPHLFLNNENNIIFKIKFLSFNGENIMKEASKIVTIRPFYTIIINKYTLLFFLVLGLYGTFLHFLNRLKFRKLPPDRPDPHPQALDQ